MRTRLRALIVAAALAMPWAVTAPPASAGADTFVMSGNGTISPGLGVVPVPQTFSFTGTATVFGTSGVGATYGCSISGGEILGEVAYGIGTASGGCAPPTWCRSYVYQRVGTKWIWVCTATTLALGAGTMECVFVPTDVNPTTKFTMTCTGQMSSA